MYELLEMKMEMRKEISGRVIELVQGDITQLQVDAIVNPANNQLILGAGVAGAIRTRGGPEIQQECDRKGPVKTGSAVLTTAGKLPARAVIHAVGPRMGEGDEDQKLQEATQNSLTLASTAGYQTIAFPAISTGVFGFPIDRCAKIMILKTTDFLHKETSLEKVVFCLYDAFAYQTFSDELAKYDDQE